MEPVKLINGRTPEQWAAYDRAEADRRSLSRAPPRRLVAGRRRAGPLPARAAANRRLPRRSPRPLSPTAAPTPDHGCADALESDVLFATDSAEFTPEGPRPCSTAFAQFSGPWPLLSEIEGHTDSTGTDAINQPLYERRAQAIVDELIKDGIDASALTARGYGSSRPVADNATPAGPGEEPPGGVPQAVTAPPLERSLTLGKDMGSGP